MSTMTFYRPVGSSELANIEAADWRAFPERPAGVHVFWALRMQCDAEQHAEFWNVTDEMLEPECVPDHLELLRDDWTAWKNEAARAYVVSFELPYQTALDLGWQSDRDFRVASGRIEVVNAALVGAIRVDSSHAESAS